MQQFEHKIILQNSCSSRKHKSPLNPRGKENDTLRNFAKKIYQRRFFFLSFVSEHPSDPALFSCPAFVIEGDDVNRSCQTSGSPPAVVTWTSGDRTNNSVLLLRNVSRSLDGHNYTCNQSWGGFSHNNWNTTTYTVQVYCEWTFLFCFLSKIKMATGASG